MEVCLGEGVPRRGCAWARVLLLISPLLPFFVADSEQLPLVLDEDALVVCAAQDAWGGGLSPGDESTQGAGPASGNHCIPVVEGLTGTAG